MAVYDNPNAAAESADSLAVNVIGAFLLGFG
jgi:fluoride ion exporter CrcB/FEX